MKLYAMILLGLVFCQTGFAQDLYITKADIQSHEVLFRVPSIWMVDKGRVVFYARGSYGITKLNAFEKSPTTTIQEELAFGKNEFDKLIPLLKNISEMKNELNNSYILFMTVDDTQMPCPPCESFGVELNLTLPNLKINNLHRLVIRTK